MIRKRTVFEVGASVWCQSEVHESWLAAITVELDRSGGVSDALVWFDLEQQLVQVAARACGEDERQAARRLIDVIDRAMARLPS